MGRLNEITPPPPPGFQDPPKITRKTSIEYPTSLNSPDTRRVNHHKHFSTSFLAEFGQLNVGQSNQVDVIGEGSTKSDPLPKIADLDIGSEKESLKDQQRSRECHDDSVLLVRQRHRNAAAAAIPIPGKLKFLCLNEMPHPMRDNSILNFASSVRGKSNDSSPCKVSAFAINCLNLP